MLRKPPREREGAKLGSQVGSHPPAVGSCPLEISHSQTRALLVKQLKGGLGKTSHPTLGQGYRVQRAESNHAGMLAPFSQRLDTTAKALWQPSRRHLTIGALRASPALSPRTEVSTPFFFLFYSNRWSRRKFLSKQ